MSDRSAIDLSIIFGKELCNVGAASVGAAPHGTQSFTVKSVFDSNGRYMLVDIRQRRIKEFQRASGVSVVLLTNFASFQFRDVTNRKVSSFFCMIHGELNGFGFNAYDLVEYGFSL